MSKLSPEREKQKKVESEEAEKREKKREEQVIAKLVLHLKAMAKVAKKEREEKVALQKTLKVEYAARQKLTK
jgi:hypothetical protein